MASNQTELGPYILVRPLGQGTGGKVKLAIHRQTQKHYAIKVISIASFERRPESEMKLQREISVMRLVDHTHVLKIFDVLKSPRHWYIVLEYAPHGELFDFLVAQGRLSEQMAAKFFRQIINGIEYLHSVGICHRDLKPENILLDENMNIKIADFGFAKFVRTGIAESGCGSPHYAAPEVMAGKPYDGRRADVWSCGVILYALCAGYLPFDDRDIRVLCGKVRKGVYTMPNFSDIARDFIRRLLVVDVDQRISIQEMKTHPFFRLGLPTDYITPAPLPVQSFVDPVDPNTVPREVLDVVRKIGYTDERLLADLSCSEHSMAKVFIFMLMSRLAVDELDWSQSVGTADIYQNDLDSVMRGPAETSFVIPAGDPFYREVGGSSASSVELGTSLACRPDWVIAEAEATEMSNTHSIVTPVDGVYTMRMVQRVIGQFGMQWFHPDGSTIIARHEGHEIFVVFQATEIPNEGRTNLHVQLCKGSTDVFSVLCHDLDEVIAMMQTGLVE